MVTALSAMHVRVRCMCCLLAHLLCHKVWCVHVRLNLLDKNLQALHTEQVCVGGGGCETRCQQPDKLGLKAKACWHAHTGPTAATAAVAAAHTVEASFEPAAACPNKP